MTTATPTPPQTKDEVHAAAQLATDPARDTAAWPLELREIPITHIELGANVRTTPTPDDLAPLVASIKARGILSPIKVAEVGAAKYELVYGQRRVMAAVIAGLSTVPALVQNGAHVAETRTIEQLLENLQREDLNPLDEARAYRVLLDAGLSQRELATQLGRAQPTIAMALRLLKVPEAIQVQVASGALSASHVKAIASLPEAEQEEVARRAVEHQLSAHDVEREVSLAQQRAASADKERDAITAALPKIEELLAKRKLDKTAVTLVVSNEPAVAAALAAAGWTVGERPGNAEYLYGQAKDGCTVYLLNWHPIWGSNYAPELQQLCVDPAHRKARAAADEKKRAEQRAKNEAAEVAQAEAREAAMTPLVEALASQPELRAQVLLWDMAGEGYGDAVEAFWASLATDRAERHVEGVTWKAVAALKPADVERWITAILAESIADEADIRAAVLVAAEPKAAKTNARVGE